jgi:hypothetical protein
MTPLLNGFSNFSSPPYSIAAYRKQGDRVWLRGVLSVGTNSQPLFILPTGFRPSGNEVFSTGSAVNQAFILISSNGEITTNGSNYLFLSGISFSTQ